MKVGSLTKPLWPAKISIVITNFNSFKISGLAFVEGAYILLSKLNSIYQL